MVRLRSTWILSLALIGGCAGGPQDTTLDIVSDVCEPTAVIASSDLSQPQLASIDDAAEFFHGLYDDEHGVVYINRALSDDHQRTVTVAHELGHAFGLLHIDRDARVSVMNPNNLSVEPNDGDAAELVALWGSCAE